MSQTDIDPFFQMVGMDDPIPMLHELRKSDPVHFVQPPGFWLVTRYDDIKRLFNDPEHVTTDKRVWEHHQPPADDSVFKWLEDSGILAVNPMEHGRLRRLVASALSPGPVRRMEGQIKKVIEEIAEPLCNRNGEVVDMLGQFTNKVPNAVVSRITGVPRGEDEEHFCAIAQSMLRGSLPFTPQDIKDQAEKDCAEFIEIIRNLVASRRQQLEEDFISDLLRAEDKDETLSEDDIVLILVSILSAGSEATVQVTTQVLRALLAQPDIMQQLRDNRSLIRESLKEILRYSFALPAGTMRFALKDFELRGKSIRKGQMLMLSVGGSNRDPDEYPNPDVLDLQRPIQETLTFGYGPHHCLGAHLAREEVSVMIDLALDILPQGSALCSDELEYIDMGMFRQSKNFPVRVGN